MLHKTSYMRGFHMVATDGVIGHVDDFLVDETLAMRYLIVDTSNWIGGKSVLVSTPTIEKIDSVEKKIYLQLTRDQVKSSPSMELAEIEPIETLPTIWIMMKG
jgi:PRC-barrel domain